MKRILLMVDAAADFPFPELGDRTPLETARMPHATSLALEGCSGSLRFRRQEADASRALLAQACGLSPRDALDVAWGPIAAAAVGLPEDSTRYACLGHFVQVDDQGQHVPVHPAHTAEQNQVLEDFQGVLDDSSLPDAQILPLSPGRFLLTLPAGTCRHVRTQVSYDYAGIRQKLPEPLRDVSKRLEACLSDHAVNAIRQDLGDPPLQSIWWWSGGHTRPARLAPGFSQALVGPDLLLQGLGNMWGMDVLTTPNPYHPNVEAFPSDAFAALLKKHDEILVWIPAPFASGRFEGVEEKVRRLDAVDYYVIGPILRCLESYASARLLLVAAGLRHRGRPEKGSGPFVLWGDGYEADPVEAWQESAAAGGSLGSLKFQALLHELRKF
jgi:2,3-bisphosphoglycerate-independent phosphoglycerate mutase